MKNRVIFLSILFLFMTSSIFADTITLKSGETVEGKIIEKKANSVRMDVYGITLTYFTSDIDKINDQKITAIVPVESSEAASTVSEQPVASVNQEPAAEEQVAPKEIAPLADADEPASNYVLKMDPSSLSQDHARIIEERLKDPRVRGFILSIIGIIFIVGFLFYIYCCLCLYFIAKKTAKEPTWLAWIPIAQLFLECKIAGLSYLWLLGYLAIFIPFIGGLVITALNIYFWYKIALARNKPGWMGILIIIPLANLVVMGYLAFSE